MQKEPYRKKIIIRIGETWVQLLYRNKHVLNLILILIFILFVILGSMER